MPVFASRPAPGPAIAAALGLLLVAGLIQWSLFPFVGSRIPFIFFLPAVGIAAMWLGWLPALIVLLGGFANAVLWLEPAGSIRVPLIGDQVALAGYLAAGAILAAMGEHMRRLRNRALDAEKVLADQVRDLRIVQELGGRVMLMSDVSEQFEAILQVLCRLLGTDQGQVYLLDAASGMLRTAASTGLSEHGRKAIEAISTRTGVAGLAFDQRRTVVVEDTETDQRFANWRDLARREGVRSVHSRPLIDMHGKVFGVLSIYFTQPRAPSERDTYLANVCAQMMSVTAERQMLAEESKAISHRSEVALESSAVPFLLVEPLRNTKGEIVDSRWNYLNNAAARLVGRQPSELMHRTTRDLAPAAWEEPGLIDKFFRALDVGATVEFEVQAPIDHTKRWFHVISSPCGSGVAVWVVDISERKHQEQLLRDADRRKDEFLATLAHELRNPLAPIRQATMIARSPTARPEQKQWSLEVIDRQVSHMAVLLDDLLDVSRITRGKLELRRRVIDLREVIDAALESTRPAIDARRQHLTLQWPDEALWAQVDPMRMSQVVSNLLANACKYTHAGGSIWLSGRKEGDEVVVEVRDDGIGIPEADLQRVFEMFTQVRHPQAGTSTGLGIGLALARGIAHMHEASLTAYSAGPDRGSTFTLRLALCRPPAEQAPRSPAKNAGHRPRRILVADDNRDAADSLAEVLRMAGHEVSVVFDGETAVRMFHETAPEVALLDIGMPGMTGNEVAAAIRSSPEGANTVLVAITGWGQERDRVAARSAGFDFHFTKPVNPDELLQVIENPAYAAQAGVELD